MLFGRDVKILDWLLNKIALFNNAFPFIIFLFVHPRNGEGGRTGHGPYLVARSLCTKFNDSKYFIPEAICVAM